MEPILNIATKPIKPDYYSQPPKNPRLDSCCYSSEKLNNSPIANTPTLEPKKMCGEHSNCNKYRIISRHRKCNSLIRWEDQKIMDETRLLYDFHQSNKEKFLQFIEYVIKLC